jgi:hypothetical protein
MGAVQSCLPFLKSKLPAELVTSGAELVLNEVEKVEVSVAPVALAPAAVASVAAALKLVPDELVAIIPQVAIDDAVKKVLDTSVEKATDKVATVDAVLETIVEKVAEEVTSADKDLVEHVNEMEKLD